MEMIRRKIKLFFVQYGKLLLIFIAIIVLIFYLIKFINKIAVEEYGDINIVQQENTEAILEENNKKLKNEKMQKDKRIIKKFIMYCQNNEIEEAYNLLAVIEKINNYPTSNDFKEKYVSNYIMQMTDYEIEEQEEIGLYKIIFYTESMLETGKNEDRKNIYDYYYIEDENININYKK